MKEDLAHFDWEESYWLYNQDRDQREDWKVYL